MYNLYDLIKEMLGLIVVSDIVKEMTRHVPRSHMWWRKWMIWWLDVCHFYVSAKISLCVKRKVQKQLNNEKGKSGGLASYSYNYKVAQSPMRLYSCTSTVSIGCTYAF